jgi:hypothetical protein
MIPEEEILGYIHEMGYLTIKPREVLPSFYKLADGTILEAAIIIESIVPDPRQQSGYQIRTRNYTVAYVPQNERKPTEYKPFNPVEILTDIVRFIFQTLQTLFIKSLEPLVCASSRPVKFFFRY